MCRVHTAHQSHSFLCLYGIRPIPLPVREGILEGFEHPRRMNKKDSVGYGQRRKREKRKREKRTLEHKIDHLTKIVGRGFKTIEKKMEHGFATVAEDIADIQDIVATKEDLAATERRLHDEIVQKDQYTQKRIDDGNEKRVRLGVRVSTLEQKVR